MDDAHRLAHGVAESEHGRHALPRPGAHLFDDGKVERERLERVRQRAAVDHPPGAFAHCREVIDMRELAVVEKGEGA